MIDFFVKINNLLKIIFLGFIHLLIDIVPWFIIYFFSIGKSNTNQTLFLISIYLFFAFGIQFVFGYIADLINNPKFVIQLGLITGLFSLIIVNYSLLISVIFIGIANSLTHVGGGIVALKTHPGKALYPGIYVAFGTLGVYEGTILGKSQVNIFSILIMAIIIMFIILYLLKLPKKSDKEVKTNSSYILPLILIFLVIFLRSNISYLLKFSSSDIYIYPLLITIFTFLGKFFGGLIADKFGWLKSSAISLFLALILFLFSQSNTLFGLLYLFFFQITMPITLTLFGDIFPKNPGFAFGFTCLGLYLGYYSSLLSTNLISDKFIIIIGILLSLFFLFISINKIFSIKYKYEYLPK